MAGCPGVGPCLPYEINLLDCCLGPSGELPDPCLLDGTPVNQTLIDNASLVASQILWAITGRQFGTCQVSLRPCRLCSDPCCLPSFTNYAYDGYGYGNYPYYPFHQEDGTWVNKSCGCQNNCSCKDLCIVQLPYPVCTVDEVKVDGVILPASEYKVIDFEQLIYTPSATGTPLPNNCFPYCNDLTKPDTEVGTWSVTLTYGRPVPELVLLGAAEMACEIIKSCVNKPCRLPQRISSVTRQGVSVSFLDTMDFLSEGLTGLYFVDLAARVYNPRRLARRPAVFSPDVKGKWNIET